MKPHGKLLFLLFLVLKNVNDFKGEYIVWLVLKVERRLKVPRFP